MKILLIEDDAVLADGLNHTLSNSGYLVTSAMTGARAKQLLAEQDFDLVVLDLGLPDTDGLQLLHGIRQKMLPLPVLILTARDSPNDKVQGMEKGADDYLTKPFELKELEARIHALFRRCYGGFQYDIVVGRLALNTRDNQVLLDGLPLPLMPREYAVMELLLLDAGKVVSKSRLAQRLSPKAGALPENAIEVYIHRVRKRVESYGISIKTIRGLGYLLEAIDV
ncbi:DNA-binding response regulator [Methylomonas lenta]|uniref:DNA-binding response regulator n=1 Tax=Methylomonas lenta TaxID=980561 RepID=A0A177NTX4_9GAMM|nr:response regulator [Methylomonas lenta]OAI20699.1 DNA-binding response regulator [Methylomonas lenta]